MKPSVSTGAVSIITRKPIRLKRCFSLKFRNLRERIRDTGIGVSKSSWGVRDTLLGPDGATIMNQLMTSTGRQGYTVGTRRVARLMRENHLRVSVKRACRTTRSLQGDKPWRNLLKTLDISHEDQVWVADITYVRLNRHFVYLALLMDVFTRMIKAWQLSQHLNQSLTLKPLQEAFCHSVCEIHHSDQGVQYLSNAYIATLQAQGVEISVAHRGRPWENG